MEGKKRHEHWGGIPLSGAHGIFEKNLRILKIHRICRPKPGAILTQARRSPGVCNVTRAGVQLPTAHAMQRRLNFPERAAGTARTRKHENVSYPRHFQAFDAWSRRPEQSYRKQNEKAAGVAPRDLGAWYWVSGWIPSILGEKS
jgi:hypothetical protein